MTNKFLDNISLPSSNPNEDLERVSRNKLEALFDEKMFLFRSELPDKGVDIIIEIKHDGKYTGFRFALQLKATASLKNAKNNPRSIQVEVSNINYLRNASMCTYYVLYEKTTDKFYYEDTSTVYNNLIKKYRNKLLPKNFTIKFNKLLDEKSIAKIYQSVSEYGLLQVRIKAHSFPDSIVKKKQGMLIDEDNEVYSVEQNIDFINQCGFSLLNEHRYDQIIEIEQRTHPRINASPMFNLVCGMAYFQRSNLFKTLEFLSLANKEVSSFSSEVRYVLAETLLDTKYLLGWIRKKERDKGMSELMKSNELGSFQLVNKAYAKFNLSGNIDELILELDALILGEVDNGSLRIMCYAKILSAEAEVLKFDLRTNSFLLCGRVKDFTKTKTYKQWSDLSEAFEMRIDSVIRYAVKKGNYLGASNIWSIKLNWIYTRIYYLHFINNWNGNAFDIKSPISEANITLLNKVVDDLCKIEKTYEKLKHTENIFMCLKNQFDVMHLLGNDEGMNKNISKVGKLLQSYNLDGLQEEYNALINGGTSHEKFMKLYSERMSKIQEVAKNSGLEDVYKSELSGSLLEYAEQNLKWTLTSNYKFDFL